MPKSLSKISSTLTGFTSFPSTAHDGYEALSSSDPSKNVTTPATVPLVYVGYRKGTVRSIDACAKVTMPLTICQSVLATSLTRTDSR